MFSVNFNEADAVKPTDLIGNYTAVTTVTHASPANTPLSDSGNSYNVTASGGTGLTFQSTNPVIAANTSGVTYSVWFNQLGSSAIAQGFLVSSSFNSNAQFGRILFLIGNSLRCNINGQVSIAVTADSNWHNVTCTYAYDPVAPTVTMYVDGKMAGAPIAATNFTLSMDTTLYVGGNAGLSPFLGLIDNVQIFSGSLTASEAFKLYAQGAAAHGIALK
jgi:hypothetical protein